MLEKCLKMIEQQKIIEFDYYLSIVDNDWEQTAKDVVIRWEKRHYGKLNYDIERTKSISRSRNRAIANSKGDFIAFIDDDEYPVENWLSNMLATINKYSADGVLGPVIPDYGGSAPNWLIKSKICERESFPTGTILNNTKYMRSGNFLIRRSILEGIEEPFDPKLGLSGGEDVDFFERMLKTKKKFVWCNEAKVYEAVPADRQKLLYHIKRAFIRGKTAADREKFISFKTAKSLIALCLYTSILPILIISNYPLFVKYLVKNCDHFSKIIAHFGIKPIKERPF